MVEIIYASSLMPERHSSRNPKPLLVSILDFRWSTYIVVQSGGVFVDYRSSDDGDGDSGSAGSAV